MRCTIRQCGSLRPRLTVLNLPKPAQGRAGWGANVSYNDLRRAAAYGECKSGAKG